jgi:hypothetical protein
LTPTERSLAVLRDLGFQAAVVERWTPHGGAPLGRRCVVCKHQRTTGLRKDLFGFIDILAVGAPGTLAIQATASGVSDRVKKILDAEHRDALIAVLEAGWRVEVWGWAKRRSKAKLADGTRSTREVTRLRRVGISVIDGVIAAEPAKDIADPIGAISS